MEIVQHIQCPSRVRRSNRASLAFLVLVRQILLFVSCGVDAVVDEQNDGMPLFYRTLQIRGTL